MKLILALVTVFSIHAKASDKPIKYPRITAAHGTGGTVWTGHGDTSFVAKESVPLIEKARFQTGPQGEIRIDVDAHRSIIIMASSEVDFPGIRPEDGSVPVVNLKTGRLRWQSTIGDGECKMESDFFSLTPGVGDYVFRVSRRPPQAEVQVLAGEIAFSATDAEDQALVKEGHRAVFSGVLENGEIAYDLLLKGKKIPRGALKPVEKVPEEELKGYDAEKRQMEEARKRAAALEAKHRAEESKAGYVCHKPIGKFNQCAVTCDGNPKGAKTCLLAKPGVRCIRRRCNANGDWAEASILPMDDAKAICQVNPVVGPCP